MGINFCNHIVTLARLMVLGIALLSIPTSVLADEATSQKPEDWDRRLEMLRSVPYLYLSETTVDESDTGVVFHNPRLVYEGYNLYCNRRSADILLMDMEGRVVHRWTMKPSWGKGSYHHVHMLENGDLIVIIENRRLLRIDWDSKLIWNKRLNVHHDVASLPDGSFYVIIRKMQEHRGLRVWFDAIAHITADGEEMYTWSTYDHLAELKNVLDTRWFLDTIVDSIKAGRSPQGRISEAVKRAVKKSRAKKVDYFHMNTVSLLPPTALGEWDSRFQQGNLLICLRNVDQIAVLEKDTYRVLWGWGEGELQWPHHPTLLKNGHILIFDNGVERNYSRVVELDPITETIVWEYKAERPEDFFSSGGGAAQRLPNGNTLICETNSGRVFEVTRDGEVVWMWLNPVTRRKRRGTVYRMMRLPLAQVDPLLKGQWWWE